MIIRVRVRAGQRKESFTIDSGGAFTISVREEARDNAANDRVRQLLARHFQTTPNRIRFVSGVRSNTKRFELQTS